MKPKTSSIPVPPLPGDVAAWSQCVCGSPRLFLEAFFVGSGCLNVKKDNEMEPFLGEAVGASQGSFGSQNVPGVSLVVFVRRGFGAIGFRDRRFRV